MPTIEFEGAQIAYNECGSGEPVVLLHSSASSAAQWNAFCDAYGERYRTVAVDLFGHGGSDPWPGHRRLALSDEAGAVAAVLNRIGEAAHLVGHSYGGAVALQVALLRPLQLKSLTLIEPVAFHLLRGGGSRDLAYFHEIAGLASDVSNAVASGDFVRGMSSFVDFWNGAGAWDSLSLERQRTLSRAIGAVALNFRSTMTEPTWRDAVAKLDLPTLVIEGEASRPVTRRICELLMLCVAFCRKTTIKGAGHMCPLTHPNTVNQSILAHIAREAEGWVPALGQQSAA